MAATVLIDLSVLATEHRLRGIGRYAADLTRSLADQTGGLDGVELVALEATGWPGPPRLSRDLQASIERLGEQPLARVSALAKTYHRLQLGNAVRQSGADLLHALLPDRTSLVPVGCRRIVTCYDLIPLRFPQHYGGWRYGLGRVQRLRERLRYAQAHHIIAISQATADDLVRILAIPAHRISVVYPGVDHDRWPVEPQPTDRAVLERFELQESPYLLCVGGADWRKNMDGMIRALALARQRPGASELVLAWAGQLPPGSVAQVEACAAQAGVADAVKLLGFVPDEQVQALYRGAVALLFVSRIEGFGYPIVEAMALGCPVVTSNSSSCIEVAADAALSVDPEDAEAAADAVATLITRPSERERLRQAGRQRASDFGVERMGRETLEIYRRLLGSSAVSPSGRGGGR